MRIRYGCVELFSFVVCALRSMNTADIPFVAACNWQGNLVISHVFFFIISFCLLFFSYAHSHPNSMNNKAKQTESIRWHTCVSQHQYICNTTKRGNKKQETTHCTNKECLFCCVCFSLWILPSALCAHTEISIRSYIELLGLCASSLFVFSSVP